MVSHADDHLARPPDQQELSVSLSTPKNLNDPPECPGWLSAAQTKPGNCQPRVFPS